MQVRLFEDKDRPLINEWFKGKMPSDDFLDRFHAYVAVDVYDKPVAFGCLIDTSAAYAYGELFKADPVVSPIRRAKAFKLVLETVFAAAIAIVPEKNTAALKLYRRMVKRGEGVEENQNFRFFAGRLS